jgi:hypothetical protein
MPRHKVRLADNIARVIFIETDATIGATLGLDVRTPDGVVGTPATVRSWLGISETGVINIGSSGGGGGVTQHRLLQGLTIGNDHPQYTRRDTLTTEGDLYVRDATSVARLGVGSEGDVLSVVSGVPAWAAFAAQEAIQFQYEGYDVEGPGDIHTVNFTGSGVTVDESYGLLTVTITGGGGSDVQYQDEGYDLGVPGDVTTIDFTGAGIAASLMGGVLTVVVPGVASGEQVAIQFQEEGYDLGDPGDIDTIDFVGAGVTATKVGTVLTVTIPGGGSGGQQTVYQENEQSITLSTSYVNSELVIALEPGAYKFDLQAFALSHATPDMKLELNFTGTATGLRHFIAVIIQANASYFNNIITAFNSQFNLTSTAEHQLKFEGMFIVTVAGTFSLRIAQVTSSGTAVTLHAGSSLVITPLD